MFDTCRGLFCGDLQDLGLDAGDVIIKFGGAPIGGLDDFDLALRKFNAGQEVQVVVRRGKEEVTLPVTLAKPRS